MDGNMSGIFKILLIFGSCAHQIESEACIANPDDPLNDIEVKKITARWESVLISTSFVLEEYTLRAFVEWKSTEGIEFDGFLYKLQVQNRRDEIPKNGSVGVDATQQPQTTNVCNHVAGMTIWVAGRDRTPVECSIPCDGLMPPPCISGGVCMFLQEGFTPLPKNIRSLHLPVETGMDYDLQLLVYRGWKAVEILNSEMNFDVPLCSQDLMSIYGFKEAAAKQFCEANMNITESASSIGKVSNISISKVDRDMEINRGILDIQWKDQIGNPSITQPTHYTVQVNNGKTDKENVLFSKKEDGIFYKVRIRDIMFDAYMVITITPAVATGKCEACVIAGRAITKVYRFPEINACVGDGQTPPYCDENATCSDMAASSNLSAVCTCNAGYSGNGISETFPNGEGCVDINFCSEGRFNESYCHHAASCIDLPPPSLSFNCSCRAGFYGDGYQFGTGCRSIAVVIAPVVVVTLMLVTAITMYLRNRMKRRAKNMSPRQPTENILTVISNNGASQNVDTVEDMDLNVQCLGDSWGFSNQGRTENALNSIAFSVERSPRRSSKTETAPGSPPPSYGDIKEHPEYVQMPNVYPISDVESIGSLEGHSDWSVGSHRLLSTVVEAPDGLNVTHLKSSGRDGIRHAPDMIIQDNHRVEYDSPLRINVNGETTDYQTLQLAKAGEAMEYLKKYSKKRITWCTDAVKKCKVTGFDVTAIFRYELVSKVEYREIISETKPYRGQILKMPCKPQSPYDYKVKVPSKFSDHSTNVVLDNTERLTECRNCNGNGKERCKTCDGLGAVTCERCHGNGTEPMTHRHCHECNGGFQTCIICHGSQRATCSKCEGKGKLVTYKVLRVNWIVKRSMYHDELEAIPDKHIMAATGEEVFSKCDCKLDPIGKEDLLHEQIRDFSRWHLCKHEKGGGVVVRQKHFVDIVPVQAVNCCYKERTPFRFYIIGLDRRVHVPKFPRKRLGFLTQLFS